MKTILLVSILTILVGCNESTNSNKKTRPIQPITTETCILDNLDDSIESCESGQEIGNFQVVAVDQDSNPVFKHTDLKFAFTTLTNEALTYTEHVEKCRNIMINSNEYTEFQVITLDKLRALASKSYVSLFKSKKVNLILADTKKDKQKVASIKGRLKRAKDKDETLLSSLCIAHNKEGFQVSSKVLESFYSQEACEEELNRFSDYYKSLAVRFFDREAISKCAGDVEMLSNPEISLECHNEDEYFKLRSSDKIQYRCL